MLKNIQYFQQPDTNKEMLRQASVQCNESCDIKFYHVDSPVKARVRELHWTGFIMDQIPQDIWDSRDRNSEFNVSFTVPRQFGHVKLNLNQVKWTSYLDVITQNEMVSMNVELEDDPQLKNIQDFLVYRNKSLIRRSKRRLKKKLTQKTLYVFWMFIGLIGLLWGMILLKESLFE